MLLLCCVPGFSKKLEFVDVPWPLRIAKEPTLLGSFVGAPKWHNAFSKELNSHSFSTWSRPSFGDSVITSSCAPILRGIDEQNKQGLLSATTWCF